MLINPLSRPLDLVGDKELNYVQDELHTLVELKDRIFVPVHGPFYRESLEIIDGVTGLKLKENVDYTTLHLLKDISKESTKEVYAVIYITKHNISSVTLSYRVPGGKYTDLSNLYRELIINYAGYRKPVYWSEILDLPEEFPVVPHKHHILDLTELGELTTALDLVINAIYSQDFEKWLALYAYADTKFKELNTYKESIFSQVESRSNALLTKASPFLKEFWFFNREINPNIEYPFGNWEQRGDYLLYGQMHNEANKYSTFTVPGGIGLQARKVALWQYIKHSTILTHKLTVNKLAVLEGESVSFTLTTTGGAGGEIYKYTVTGAMRLTGEVVLNSSGVGIINITIPIDQNTNGLRKLKLTIDDKPYLTKEIDVVDVVKSGHYAIGMYKDQYGVIATDTIDEGDIGYAVIKAVNVPDGTVITLIYEGDLHDNDLLVPLPSTVAIYDNIASVEIKPKLDKLTDGNKYLKVGISVDNVVLPSVATVLYVRDISKTPTFDTYWASAPNSEISIMNASEGSIAYLIIDTANIPTTTNATIAWSGSAKPVDFTTALPTSVSIDASGKNVIPVTIKADNLTEGLETIVATVKIGTDFEMTVSILVDDISRNDNIDVRFSTNSIGTNNLSTVNEGSSIYLVIKTEDIPNEGKLKLVWNGTADSDDFLSELPEYITIKDNYGYLNILIKPDNKTEGNEILNLSVYDQAFTTLIATQSLTIIDSSTAPTYEVLFSGQSGKLTAINEAKESDVVYGVIKTTQVPDGTVMFVETLIGDQLATYGNGDVLIDVARTVVIDAGIAFFPIHLRMDERKDGDKNVVIRLRKDSANSDVISTKSLLVKDTSVAPTYNLRWSSTYENVTTINSAQAGQTVYAHIQTTSIAAGTALYVEYGGAGIGIANTISDFLQQHSDKILPRIVRIDGEGKAVVAISISKTLLGTTDLNLRLTLSRDASNATHVIHSTLNIVKATYTVSFASNASGTATIATAKEGQTIYGVLRTTNIPNNTVFDIHTRIGNETAIVSNKDVTIDIPTKLTIVNNIGTVPIVLVKDLVIEGTEQLDLHVLYDHMGKDEEMIYFATQTINVTES